MMYIKGIGKNSVRLTIFESEAMYLFGMSNNEIYLLQEMGVKAHFGEYGILCYDGWYDE